MAAMLGEKRVQPRVCLQRTFVWKTAGGNEGVVLRGEQQRRTPNLFQPAHRRYLAIEVCRVRKTVDACGERVVEIAQPPGAPDGRFIQAAMSPCFGDGFFPQRKEQEGSINARPETVRIQCLRGCVQV